MEMLKLSWENLNAIKEQIEAAEEGLQYGHTGQITVDSEYTVEWSDHYIILELPEDENLRIQT